MTQLYEEIEDAVHWWLDQLHIVLFCLIVGCVVLPLICVFDPEHMRAKRAQHRKDRYAIRSE